MFKTNDYRYTLEWLKWMVVSEIVVMETSGGKLSEALYSIPKVCILNLPRQVKSEFHASNLEVLESNHDMSDLCHYMITFWLIDIDYKMSF